MRVLKITIFLSILAVINTFPVQKELRETIKHVSKDQKYKDLIKLTEESLQSSSQLSNDVLMDILKKSLKVQEGDNSTGCECQGYNCGCCLHLKWDLIDLDDTVCTNLSYLPKPEYGISVTLTVGDKTIINETISARNPPPICVEVPYLKKLASLCLRFKNLQIRDQSMKGCVYLEGRLLYVETEEIKLGCFTIPPNNQTLPSQVSPTLPRSILTKLREENGPDNMYMDKERDNSKLYYVPSRKNKTD